jgi:hypothetical protein
LQNLRERRDCLAMPRGAHIDHTATASARASQVRSLDPGGAVTRTPDTGVLRDRRSFISTDGRVFLEGKDVRRARARVFGRDEGLCVDCGEDVWFEDWTMGLGMTMELSHEKPKSLGGDDSDANLRTRCRRCHRKKDLHGCEGHF